MLKKDTTLDDGGPGQGPDATDVSSAVSLDTTLDGGGRGENRGSLGVSSDVSLFPTIPQPFQAVKPDTTGPLRRAIQAGTEGKLTDASLIWTLTRYNK